MIAVSDSMEDLKYAIERSEAETPDELIEYANGLYLSNPAHDAFVHGAGSAGNLVEKKIRDRLDQLKEFRERKKKKVAKEYPEHRAETVAHKSYDSQIKELQLLLEELSFDSVPVEEGGSE
jgi:hypothetical protein